MTSKKFSLLILPLFILMTSLPFLVQAQDNETKSTNGLEFNSDLGGYYFLDQLSSSFININSTYTELIDIDSYILGAGDLVSIKIDGSQEILLRGLIINPQGQIVTPLFNPISLNGLSITDAQKKIESIASKLLINPEVIVTLEQARQVIAYVTGGVPYPGKFINPPFSRVDEVIYPAIKQVPVKASQNEPVYFNTSELLQSKDFDFRNIVLIRANGDTLVADLVAFFRTGDLKKNPIVQDGDQIFIKRLSVKNPSITISGAVISNYETEYKTSDTPYLLIELAGGYSPNANKEVLYVFRNTNGKIQKLEFSRSEWGELNFQPNDRLVVPSLYNNNPSASAEIFGEVNTPGFFPIIEGETSVLDLLQLSGGITEKALPSAAFLERGEAAENQILNKFNVDLMKRTSNQLQQGFEYLELETQNSKNRVFTDLFDEEQLKNLNIYNGDKLYIPRDEQTIFVFGQVNNPGYYPFTDKSTSVSGYITKAGGFALSADKDRVFIIKAGINTWYKPEETELQSGDKIFIDRTPYEELNALRSYEVQKQQLKNTRTQLILTAITTITGIITTYVAIDNYRRNN